MLEEKLVKLSIYESSLINKNEISILKKMFNDEFGHINLQWSDPSWYLIAKYNNFIIGRIGILKRKIKVGNSYIEVGGISGAVIIKEYRGKKIFKKMIFKTYDFFINHIKVKYGLLLCKDEIIPIYEKCNWSKINTPLTFLQDKEINNNDYNIMIIELSNFKWPKGKINLNGFPW